ncbi:homoserine kinase [Paenisporosarcina sp. TG20]|uniref:homoserine kinase n=1 Tax=Paenisporosarcina sp. TG20 TaxID=1211706 RepID=UPI0002E97124|nr:homoserine kinase [Paenisporosarcina sp. TG20]
MSWKQFSVIVPASTANLGPGFDSIGLALNLHMSIDISPASEWAVEYSNKEYQHLSSNSDNLIVSTAQVVAGQFNLELPTSKLNVETDIPLGKGLGSSAAAIAAGIEIADRSLGLNLSMKEKVKIGSAMEGHPDNISASFLGGLTISYFDGDQLEGIHVPEVDIGVLILVPSTEFLTKESRGLLPEKLDHNVAIQGSAAGNVLSGALTTGDWNTAGRIMEKDTFHEPFRKYRFPDFEAIRQACRQAGAYGSAISGAGPSLFIAVRKGDEQKIGMDLKEKFPHYECLITKPSLTGIRSYENRVD